MYIERHLIQRDKLLQIAWKDEEVRVYSPLSHRTLKEKKVVCYQKVIIFLLQIFSPGVNQQISFAVRILVIYKLRRTWLAVCVPVLSL